MPNNHFWDVLRDAVAGDVLLPGSSEYESARKPAIPRFHDARPSAVVRCSTPADVAHTISFARRVGLNVASRSGGHCFAGRSSTSGVVIDVGPMCSIMVEDRVVTVGAGARLRHVYDALADYGVTIPAGCGPEVGIAGLTLGGGLGILGRVHGLTCDQLVAAQIVLANSQIVECDSLRHPDLFWALRGAGAGQLGVVTSLAFRTVTAPVTTTFHLRWPYQQAAAVVAAWQAWAPEAPDELAASLLLAATADGVQPPTANAFGALIGSEEQTARLLDELVIAVGVEPILATHQQRPYREAKSYLTALGEAMTSNPDTSRKLGHSFCKSEFFRRSLPDEAIVALVDHFAEGPSPGQPRNLDFTPWGGAYNRVPVEATAFAHRDARFLLKHGIVIDPDASPHAGQAARRWLARSWELVRPWGMGAVYPNFPDPDLDQPQQAYYRANLERLAYVRANYDPQGFFSESLPGRQE